MKKIKNMNNPLYPPYQGDRIKQQAGFSLLEVIGVLAIVSVGLIGILSLVNQNLQVQYINKNSLIASQLAQEGLEIIKNRRDTNWVQGLPWDNNLGVGKYAMDYTGYTASGLADINDARAKLKINGSGFYEHQIGTVSNFSRLLEITNKTAASSSVICTIQYQEGINKFKYIAELKLYDWGERW